VKELNYKLASDWLGDGNSPTKIGGSSTDVSSIGYSITDAVKDWFPINEVPQEIVDKLEELQIALNVSDVMIEAFIRFFTEWIEKDRN